VVTGQAVQLHGAVGFTEECDLGFYVNRALVLSAYLGNASMHRSRYYALSNVEEHPVSATARMQGGRA
jgi:alkylation response protein AidB-like acyl-CoA dehydrogenase